MKELILNTGDRVQVDDADFELASHWKWSCRDQDGKKYATRSLPPGSKRHTIYLHRFLMGPPDGIECDHRDGNGLNCQRSNMRAATRSQNLANKKLGSHSKTGFKGVQLFRNGRYLVRVMKDRKMHYLGYFTNPIEGALAYDRKAVELHGEFALTNKMLGLL